jgi:hypothetical protein
MRKKRSDSISDDVKSFAQAGDTVQLPAGITLDDEVERIVWSQMTATRSKDSWREFDLLLLSKIVKIEARLRKHQLQLDIEGVVMFNDRGTPIENPLTRVIDTLTRQQMTVIRSMSLNQSDSDPRTLNATGVKNSATNEIIAGLDSDLIPRLRILK